jgi:hypothetical protein
VRTPQAGDLVVVSKANYQIDPVNGFGPDVTVLRVERLEQLPGQSLEAVLSDKTHWHADLCVPVDAWNSLWRNHRIRVADVGDLRAKIRGAIKELLPGASVAVLAELYGAILAAGSSKRRPT